MKKWYAGLASTERYKERGELKYEERLEEIGEIRLRKLREISEKKGKAYRFAQ